MSNPAPVLPSVRWISVQAAAEILGLTSAALRKSLDRRAVRSADGGIEAELDGVRGRKLGRLWRVALSPAWAVPNIPKSGVQSGTSQSVRADREGPDHDPQGRTARAARLGH
jgi:hypothetical protein